MHWPQIIMSVLYVLGFAISVEKAGESKGKYSPVGFLFSAIPGIALLYFGGFFAVWGWAP